MVVGLTIFLTPLAVLVVLGLIFAAQGRRRVWISVAVLALVSTVVWLVYVGLYQHETPCNGRIAGCPTVYGYNAPLPDEAPIGMLLLLAGFALPAAWVGWRRSVPPVTAGAALALGPTVLALWTAPRGDNDGLWALILWFLPVLGGLAAVVVAVVGRVRAARPRSPVQHESLTVATCSDRLAALAIDVAILGVVLVVPLTALSRAQLELAAWVMAITVATAYLALPLSWKRRTLGQSLVGLFVTDARTNQSVPVARAVIRSVVVVVEIAALPTLIFAVPALIEVIVLGASGRTLTDRLLGTSVLCDRRPAGASSVSASP